MSWSAPGSHARVTTSKVPKLILQSHQNSRQRMEAGR
jgi:hypothetical protein